MRLMVSLFRRDISAKVLDIIRVRVAFRLTYGFKLSLKESYLILVLWWGYTCKTWTRAGGFTTTHSDPSFDDELPNIRHGLVAAFPKTEEGSGIARISVPHSTAERQLCMVCTSGELLIGHEEPHQCQ